MPTANHAPFLSREKAAEVHDRFGTPRYVYNRRRQTLDQIIANEV